MVTCKIHSLSILIFLDAIASLESAMSVSIVDSCAILTQISLMESSSATGLFFSHVPHVSHFFNVSHVLHVPQVPHVYHVCIISYVKEVKV